MSSLVVDKESACLGLRNEVSIPLDGNHRTICRFASARESGLHIILDNLVSIATSRPRRPATAAKAAVDLTFEERQFLGSLDTSDPEAHMDRNPRPVGGTCSWILRHPTYKSWYEAPASALLWLSADPGCGKSVLASFLVRYYSERRSPRWNVCYFFFKSDNEEQRDGVHALQAVLRQLYLQQPHLVKAGHDLLNKSSRIRTMDALWRAFVAGAEDVFSNDTICILDGLDECDAASRRVLVNLAVNHISPRQEVVFDRGPKDEEEEGEKEGSEPKHVVDSDSDEEQDSSTEQIDETAENHLPRLKIFITGRPENSLKAVLDRPPPKGNAKNRGAGNRDSSRRVQGRGKNSEVSIIRLRGENEVDAISDDVSLFIKSDISYLEDQGLPPDILSDMQEKLIARADRTFLWVSLILQLLRERVESGASQSELNQTLESRDIYAVYSDLLQARLDAPKARRMLNIILAASRPMTVEELSIALAIQLNDPSAHTLKSRNLDEVELDLVFPFENHIKALCGHFVRVIRNRVYLVHETAREFLLGPSLSPGNPWQHSFNLSTSRRILLDICVTYLYCLGQPSSRTARFGFPTPHTSQFLDFAAIEWVGLFKEERGSRNSPDERHYYNLCHPRFPGFRAWAPKALRVPAEVLMNNAGLSDDRLQDECIKLLELRVSDGDYNDLWARNSSTGGLFDVSGAGSEMSCNPGALSNHGFPLTVDERGIVQLDLGKGFQPSKRRNTGNNKSLR